MGKRKLRPADGDKPRKRLRIVPEAPTSEEIHTSRQLRQLLQSDPDLQKARHGLQSFKLLLDELNDPDKESSAQLAILKAFLESSKTTVGGDEDGVYLPDIIETWKLGAAAHNEDVMSAVPVVLALLLKVISADVSLESYGLGVGRTLLQKQQQELLAQNLSADKGKAFIISPTLRLLREVICFSGGALAKAVFRARNHTYRSLARNMGIKYLGDGLEEAKRPSTRTNTIRFFLSSLKYLHVEAKTELLSQRELVPALVKTLKDDPPYLVVEILEALNSHVLLDKAMSKIIKGRAFNAKTLIRISGLYGYHHDAGTDQKPVDEVVHEFLVRACTSRSGGILRHQFGFYPRGVEPDEVATGQGEDGEESTLDHIVWLDKFTEEIPVHNTALAEFIQSLRPWSSTKQNDLLVSIFAASPELVSWYFIDKTSFSFEPKLSATWIGYSALIFSTVQLDIPPFFGNKSKYARAPPPTSIIVDNIIPLPLSQKSLARCLSHKSRLVSFFATRLMVLVLSKLQDTLRLYEEASTASGALWSESARRVVDGFCQRCPNLKDVVNAYRGIPESDWLHRLAASRVLRLYYEVIPQLALLAKFDVTPLLIGALKRLEASEDAGPDSALRMAELGNLLVVAGYSPGMRWFTKADGLELSPFTTLAVFCIETREDHALASLREVLGFVAREHQLFLPETESSGLSALLEALHNILSTWPKEVFARVCSFVDNSVVRCGNAPIKYLDAMQDLVDDLVATDTVTLDTRPISPIILTLVEQLPFATLAADPETLEALADFFALYLGLAALVGEQKPLLERVLEDAVSAFPEACPAVSRLCIPENLTFGQNLQQGAVAEKVEPKSDGLNGIEGVASGSGEALEAVLDVSLPTTEDTSALLRWSTKPADDLVEDGHAASLIMLLASAHTSIRKEALTNILKMAAKLRESEYDEKEPVWLLLSELAESAKGRMDEGPLPGHIASFACHALEVLKDPLHSLYEKVNSFLTSRPAWRLDRLPLVHDVLQEAPTQDDSYYAGLKWLLAYLLDSLRTPAELSLFHGKRLFERILSLMGNPYMRQPLRMQLLKIVYRASQIEGGSTTLITRFGILGWLDVQALQCESADEAGLYVALLKRVWDTCDQDRVSVWSQHGVEGLVGCVLPRTLAD